MNTRISRVRLFVPIITILMISITQYPTLAEDGESDYPAQISLEFEDGSVIDEIITISGYLRDESFPESATWELKDSSGTRHFVDFTDDLRSQSNLSTWNEWSFDIEINPEIIGPCSCIIIISAIDTSGNSFVELQSVFISPSSIPNQQLPPTIHIIRDSISSWSSETYTVEAITHIFDTGESIISYLFSESTNIKCSYSSIQIPSTVTVVNTSDIIMLEESAKFNIDLLQLQDGWFDLIIFATNPVNQEFSHDCISIRIDNSPPVALIEGPTAISEGGSEVLLDGSASYDGIWGIQGLTYIWSVLTVDGSSESIMEVNTGNDQRSVLLQPNFAGTFEIKLTISDKAGNLGHSSHILEVENLAPVVRMAIDGEPIEDNDEFPMSKDSTCLIDASGSSDTSNDIENLRYIWRVNNIPTYEGTSRDFSWPENVEGDFVLTLEVIDDDSESSMISVLITDADADSPFPISILVLIISAIFFTYSVINYRNTSNETEIPKWT